MIGPKEKKERSLGVNLGLKPDRCSGAKCVMMRRPNRPGMHGGKHRRGSQSDFGRQLQEKQKFKVSYGIDEKGLARLFNQAEKSSGGDLAVKFVELLERRLDNVVFRMSLAGSRSAARQLVRHGHIVVNNKRVRAPGYEIRTGDKVGPYKKGDKLPKVLNNLKEKLMGKQSPVWLKVNPESGEGEVVSLPKDVDMPFEVNLLVESFSK